MMGWLQMLLNSNFGKTLISWPNFVDHYIRASRDAQIKISGKIIGVKEGRISYGINKAINVEITKIEVRLKSGTKVRELSL